MSDIIDGKLKGEPNTDLWAYYQMTLEPPSASEAGSSGIAAAIGGLFKKKTGALDYRDATTDLVIQLMQSGVEFTDSSLFINLVSPGFVTWDNRMKDFQVFSNFNLDAVSTGRTSV